MLLCSTVAAQTAGTTSTTITPPTLTDVTFSSPFVNIGGSPQNIFVTAVPAGASVANCAITTPSTALATYNPTYLLGPTITVSPAATGTTQAVEHTFTCGAVSKTFVVKPPTCPAEILLSGTELQVGSTTTQNLFVTVSPAGTVLPACTISSTPALATVTVDPLLGTRVALTPSADAITTNATQTVTCGSLSKTFTVKPKVVTVPVINVTASGPITNQTISGSLTVPTADQGKQGSVFIVIVFNGTVFLVDANGGFTPYNPSTTVPPAFTGALGTHSLNVVRTALDLTSARGADIYIGYGLGGPLSPTNTAWNAMLTHGTYKKAYTIN